MRKNKTAPIVQNEETNVAPLPVVPQEAPKWITDLSPLQRIEFAENIKAQAMVELQGQKAQLENQLAALSKILGQPAAAPSARSARTESSSNGVTDKILSALKGGSKTSKELQTAAGTKWIAVALSKLQQENKVVSDGKRPATFSLK